MLSQVSIFMIFYMTILTLIQLKPYKNEKKREYKQFESDPLILLKNIGTFIYVFCGMNNFHQAYTTVKFPTVRRVTKMGSIAITFVLILVLIFGMAAYFSLGQDLLDIDLFPDRDPLGDNKSDIANKILKSSKFFIYFNFN